MTLFCVEIEQQLIGNFSREEREFTVHVSITPHTHTYTHTHIHTYTHIHIHTYTHIHNTYINTWINFINFY